MKRIKILYAGALVALSFSSVGCNGQLKAICWSRNFTLKVM